MISKSKGVDEPWILVDNCFADDCESCETWIIMLAFLKKACRAGAVLVAELGLILESDLRIYIMYLVLYSIV